MFRVLKNSWSLEITEDFYLSISYVDSQVQVREHEDSMSAMDYDYNYPEDYTYTPMRISFTLNKKEILIFRT